MAEQTPPVPPITPSQHSGVTWRALLLGLLGAAFICGITPYNDYALNNTFMVGNNLPLGVVMLMFLLVVGINGPLSRFAPRFALASGELAIIFSMMLVSCALPSSGLMRYLPASLVAPFWHEETNPQYVGLLKRLNLPEWIFPRSDTEVSSPSQDPVVYAFMDRWTGDGPPPYSAWIVPIVAWGIFLFALYGALMCMVTLVRRQWYENERLQFPLAQIQMALVEQPRAGRFFNSILSRPSFWLSFGAVFSLHGWNALGRYFPLYVPHIPVYYNLADLFVEPPLVYVDYKIKDAAIFFTVTGITYFVSTPVAFSLWFFFILDQIYRMWLGMQTGDGNHYGQDDEHLGGLFAFTLVVLWVGRHHWWLILKQAFRGPRGNEPRGRYLSYRFAFWSFLTCLGVMWAWLVIAGCTGLGATLIVVMLIVLFFVITRIIAETGLVHGQLQAPLYKPWQWASLAGTEPVPARTFFLTALVNSHHFDFREVMPVYASYGIKLTDQTIVAQHPNDDIARRSGRKIIAALMLALLVGYLASFAGTLWTEYTYSWTQDTAANYPLNDWGTQHIPVFRVLEPTVQYERGTWRPVHSVMGHGIAGFLITLALGVLRLYYTWWPLHPIGYLMLGTYPSAHLWFSIMIGWLAKVLILRFGGSRLYETAKPFFIGLIVGESMAAGFWLAMGMILNAMGIPYQTINIMPG